MQAYDVEISDGTLLNVREDGAGDPLLFFHGSLGTGDETFRLLGGLTRDYRLIAPDIRGRGRSLCASEERYSWAQYADDVTAVVDHLGIDRAVLGGISLGAGVALAAGFSIPRRVKGLVLVASPFMGQDVGWSVAQAANIAGSVAFAERIRAVGLEAALAAVEAAIPKEWAAARRAQWSKHDAASISAATIADASIGQPFARLECLASITCPTLVVPGVGPTHDPAVSEAYMSVLPAAALREISMPPDPMALESVISQWLNQLPD